MTQLTKTAGQFPKNLVGTLVFTSSTGTFTKGETVTGAGGFSAKVLKWDATKKTLTVNRIVGVPPATTITGGTSAATGTPTAFTTASISGLDYKTGGWNILETKHGITRSTKIGTRILVEVLIALSNMVTKRT